MAKFIRKEIYTLVNGDSNQFSDYSSRSHRAYIRSMEADAKIHTEHWVELPKSSQREGGVII